MRKFLAGGVTGEVETIHASSSELRKTKRVPE